MFGEMGKMSKFGSRTKLWNFSHTCDV